MARTGEGVVDEDDGSTPLCAGCGLARTARAHPIRSMFAKQRAPWRLIRSITGASAIHVAQTMEVSAIGAASPERATVHSTLGVPYARCRRLFTTDPLLVALRKIVIGKLISYPYLRSAPRGVAIEIVCVNGDAIDSAGLEQRRPRLRIQRVSVVNQIARIAYESVHWIE